MRQLKSDVGWLAWFIHLAGFLADVMSGLLKNSGLGEDTHRTSRLQNVAGLDEISLGQTSWIGAKIRAGLRNARAESGKSGAKVPKSGQKLEARDSSLGPRRGSDENTMTVKATKK